jgi:glycosyltransferase involved in cell wall biosynthesis
MLRHDAYAVLSARGRGGWPVVLRAEGVGQNSDCAWQAKANFGHRIARACHAADAIVAPSAVARDELLAAGYPAERVHLIPNGVAIPVAPPDAATKTAARAALAAANDELKLPEGAPLVVFTGRLHAEKGLATLVDAWGDVFKQHRHARLWLVGAGPCEGELEDQIRRARLADRVVLAGAFDAVDDVLAAADLFVLPSRCEGLSLSLLEALAAGVPAVATDIPGNRLVIKNGRHGLLVPPGDAAALADAINSLLAERPRAATLAAAGRDRVSREFNLGKMVAEHLRLFHALMAGNPCLSDGSP